LKHLTSPDFWESFDQLPTEIQQLARANYELLKNDPRHPSLRLKKARGYWVARIGLHYRALGRDVEGGILWGWIGTHAEYDRIMSS
jgi:hypothetical protein